MAAVATSALRLPVSSVVLVVLLLGNAETIPVVILSAVVAFVTTELLPVGPSVPSAEPQRQEGDGGGQKGGGGAAAKA
ncbi:hypothetical protein [Streptomyces sp. NPDC005408]|uniref:hypothetical protein n=1 Tax=Streptomyces sp. NPDC005408 TaxID=3155341 RepID=UPI0033AE300B